MNRCVACGAKAKEIRLDMDYCKICAINFDNRMQSLDNSDDVEAFEKNRTKVIDAINTKDKYSDENKEKVINYMYTRDKIIIFVIDFFINHECQSFIKRKFLESLTVTLFLVDFSHFM